MNSKSSVVAFLLLITCTILSSAQTHNLPRTAVADSRTIDASHLIQPEELAKILKASAKDKPLIFMVGFRTMYTTRRIPGAEYTGAASDRAGLQQLRDRVSALPKKTSIVLYCGCCPWPHCPNVDPAFTALRDMGFTNVKVLYLATNFGKDWIEKGYPVEKGD
jgi:thiosulfate/3-mercaptopyruvate sulfurtransferase